MRNGLSVVTYALADVKKAMVVLLAFRGDIRPIFYILSLKRSVNSSVMHTTSYNQL